MASVTELSSATGIATNLISSTLTITQFIRGIRNAPLDVKGCLNLTGRVEMDRQHLISLQRKHQKYLETVPEIANRQTQIIHDARQSINDVCRLLEGCRPEVYEGQSIPLLAKMKWALGDNTAFGRRAVNLQQQHAAINLEIAHLRQVEILFPLEKLAATTFENLELLTMERKNAQDKNRWSEQEVIDPSGKSAHVDA
jgi:hypothetical protein